MSLDEFLDITPRYFMALREQATAKRRLDQEVTEVMVAQLIVMVQRTAFLQYETPLTAGNLIGEARGFMPREWVKQAAEKPKRLTKKEQQRMVEARRSYWRMVCGVKS